MVKPKLLMTNIVFMLSLCSFRTTSVVKVRQCTTCLQRQFNHRSKLYLSTIATNNDYTRGTTKTNERQVKTTGLFIHQLPDLHSGPAHFNRAIKYNQKIKLDLSIKNVRKANRKLTAFKLDNIMKSLTTPITSALKAYKKQLRLLHPFEMTVVDLTIIARNKAGKPNLENTLKGLRALRASTSRIAKDFASRGAKASTAKEARELLLEGINALETHFVESPEVRALDNLRDIQKDLRRIPRVELDVPTVVLVGSPNVGKSSLVRAISSGTPEVNDYPFTTRGVTIGHIVDQVRGLRFQVMDTPGLLDRPTDQRNEMEKLTFASMSHLPTAVIFVIDPSGLSGEKSTLQAQLNVRSYLKSRFPRRPWIDVVSKSDVPLTNEVMQKLPPGFIHVSVLNDSNITLLKELVEDTLVNLRTVITDRLGTAGSG